ncbi:MAG: hypothetical protein K2X48_15125 [Chitinophagaceae bacterium]|nr:hypothetical protein [Chitinophagaceae bacterium]
MGLIKEPLNVDFYVDPKPLTKKEREAISKHIREYKEKMAKNKRRLATSGKKAPVLSR